jgi:hypothetical protein
VEKGGGAREGVRWAPRRRSVQWRWIRRQGWQPVGDSHLSSCAPNRTNRKLEGKGVYAHVYSSFTSVSAPAPAPAWDKVDDLGIVTKPLLLLPTFLLRVCLRNIFGVVRELNALTCPLTDDTNGQCSTNAAQQSFAHTSRPLDFSAPNRKKKKMPHFDHFVGRGACVFLADCSGLPGDVLSLP